MVKRAKKKPNYDVDFKIFRTQAWVRHTLNKFQIDLKTFAKLAIRHASAKGQANAWYYGTQRISPQVVQAINKKLEGSADVFNLPLFHLLTAKKLDEKAIHRILSPYYRRDPEGYFQRVFPPSNSISLTITSPYEYKPFFFNELVYRADIHAFTLLLGIHALAVIKMNTMIARDSLAAIWRILPAITHLGWIWPMRTSLQRHCWKLYERMSRDDLVFAIDTKALETLMHCWRHDPTSFREYWHSISWNSGPLDPVVVYERRLRRPINGEHEEHGESDSSSIFFEQFRRYDFECELMPENMSEKQWHAYIAR